MIISCLTRRLFRRQMSTTAWDLIPLLPDHWDHIPPRIYLIESASASDVVDARTMIMSLTQSWFGILANRCSASERRSRARHARPRLLFHAADATPPRACAVTSRRDQTRMGRAFLHEGRGRRADGEGSY